MPGNLLGPTPRQQRHTRHLILSGSMILFHPAIRQRMPHPFRLQLRGMPGKPIHFEGKDHQKTFEYLFHRLRSTGFPGPNLRTHIINHRLPIRSAAQCFG